jgi:hypothetical protein
MLFALLATFLGVFLDSYFPNYRPTLDMLPAAQEILRALDLTVGQSGGRDARDYGTNGIS